MNENKALISAERSDEDLLPNGDGAPAGIIELNSGQWIDILNPDPEKIILGDIASGLGKICRFQGQTSRFYSVAEHSVLCGLLIKQQTDDPTLIKAALLHDAHETYLGDIPTPIKKIMSGWISIADRIDQAIAERFELDHALFTSEEVKTVDRQALSIEAHQFMSLTTPGFKEGMLSPDDLPAEVIDSELDFSWPLNEALRGEELFLRFARILDIS
jgi:hypothetical protein